MASATRGSWGQLEVAWAAHTMCLVLTASLSNFTDGVHVTFWCEQVCGAIDIFNFTIWRLQMQCRDLRQRSTHYSDIAFSAGLLWMAWSRQDRGGSHMPEAQKFVHWSVVVYECSQILNSCIRSVVSGNIYTTTLRHSCYHIWIQMWFKLNGSQKYLTFFHFKPVKRRQIKQHGQKSWCEITKTVPTLSENDVFMLDLNALVMKKRENEKWENMLPAPLNSTACQPSVKQSHFLHSENAIR